MNYPLEFVDKLPTCQNTIGCLWCPERNSCGRAAVYIHHSGHGGRAKDSFPISKGRMELDEVLVPYRYWHFRKDSISHDLDLSTTLLQELVDKTNSYRILDCCHSGAAYTRRCRNSRRSRNWWKPLKPGQELEQTSRNPAATSWTLLNKTTRGLKNLLGLHTARDYVLF
jgi:hypothetical protein